MWKYIIFKGNNEAVCAIMKHATIYLDNNDNSKVMEDVLVCKTLYTGFNIVVLSILFTAASAL